MNVPESFSTQNKSSFVVKKTLCQLGKTIKALTTFIYNFVNNQNIIEMLVYMKYGVAHGEPKN